MNIVFVLKSAASHPESGLMLEFFLLASRRVSEDISAVSEGVWCISTSNIHSSRACSPLSLAGGSLEDVWTSSCHIKPSLAVIRDRRLAYKSSKRGSDL